MGKASSRRGEKFTHIAIVVVFQGLGAFFGDGIGAFFVVLSSIESFKRQISQRAVRVDVEVFEEVFFGAFDIADIFVGGREADEYFGSRFVGSQIGFVYIDDVLPLSDGKILSSESELSEFVARLNVENFRIVIDGGLWVSAIGGDVGCHEP